MANQGYQVLARKWRPQQFDEVVGQKPVVQTLANALDQRRTAHAYCFSGIRGVGKTTIARLLAKGLNCRAGEQPTSTPCGTCESCVEVVAGRSMDVFERDAASDRGINEMKELIEIARYSPARDRYKVMILDEAHMLTPEASNALLKVLEEPPAYIVFVLATTEPSKILPTILSRCQHYQFGRISQREISDHLERIANAENVTISSDGLALVATAADGSLRDAQSLLDKLIAFAGEEIDENTVIELLGLVDRVLLFRATDLIIAQDLAGVLGFVNEMVDTGVDLHQFAIDLLGHVRNLLVVRTVQEPGDILHLPETDLVRLRQQAETMEVDDLDRAFSLIAANEYRIKMAEQPRYHVEVMLARLARMPTLEPIENLIAALEGNPSPGRPRGSGGPGGSGGSGEAAKRSSPPRQAAPQAPTAVSPNPSARASTAGAPTPEPAPRVPAPVAPEPEPEPTPTAAQPAVAAELPAVASPKALLQRIQERVNQINPLVAPILGRTSGLSLAGETLVFQFPPSAGIFADRVRDAATLQMIASAAQEVLGRRVIARVEIDPKAASPMAAPPTTSQPVAAPPVAPLASVPLAAAQQSIEPERAAPPQPGTVATPPTSEKRESLRQRAENEPKVQEFVRVLRGTITSVEEL